MIIEKINQDKLQTSTEVLRALTHPLRMKILAFIDKNKSINVNKIYRTLELEQSITSQHLKILSKAGLVDKKRDGKFIHYSVNYKKVGRVVNVVNEFLM